MTKILDRLYRRALARMGRPRGFYSARGNAARDRGDWQDAASAYKTHLRLHGGDTAIRIQLGHALARLGDHRGANAAYTLASFAAPDDADLMLHRGHLARRHGDVSAAESFYQASFDIDGGRAAKEALASLNTPLDAPPIGVVDRLTDGTISGWVVDPEAPEAPARFEILVNDEVVAEDHPRIFRKDVIASGLGNGVAGFEVDIADRIKKGDQVLVRLKRTAALLAGVPITFEEDSQTDRWMARNAHLTATDLDGIKVRCQAEAGERRLDLVLSVEGDTALDPLVESLQRQWCANWRLICVTTAVSDADTLDIRAMNEPRIRVIRLAYPAKATHKINRGLAQADGALVWVVAPGQTFEPEAVHRLLDIGPVDLVYADEALCALEATTPFAFDLRPAFAYHYFLCSPYFLDGFAFAGGLLGQVVGLDEDLPPSAARLDFVLRIIEQTAEVAHVPAVLTRRKAGFEAAPSDVDDVVVDIIQKHLTRWGDEAQVSLDSSPGVANISFPDPRGRTLIVIPTKDRTDLLETCLESVWRTTAGDEVDIVVIDHDSKKPASRDYLGRIADRVTVKPYSGIFNFARMNNLAFADCSGAHDFVLFMNNDIEAIECGWLERMRSLAARPDVGVVGANLLFANRTIQHSGVILGMSGAADHAHRLAEMHTTDGINRGYGDSLVVTREYSAVTAACMMMRSGLFRAVGGYDEELTVGFNDTDLCLRVREAGYLVLNDGPSVLYHHESATRTVSQDLDHPADLAVFIARWRDQIARGDPFYNPLLSLRRDYRHGDLTETRHPTRIRPSRPIISPAAVHAPRRIRPAVVFP